MGMNSPDSDLSVPSIDETDIRAEQLDVLDPATPPTHGLVEWTGPTDGPFVTVDLQPAILEAFAKQCQELGWEEVTMHVRPNFLLLARPRGSEADAFVAMAPLIPDDEMPDGTRGAVQDD